MASIHLVTMGHAYTPGTYALKPSDIQFEDGKTYALLGPSGCGKTTLLNIISGLVRPSEGAVYFNDSNVTAIPTERRNIAQVFQFPVIYQSKTVFDNLAFPLRCRHWDKRKIEARVREIANILGLDTRLRHSARGLSADEKQLISLGRGLVRDDVAAILMDEPLTVIDPQLKFELRRKIKLANEQTRLTVIYVTHDQNEAMSIADEVLVMEQGSVVQRDTPSRLFESPINTFVGHFIGSPGMNFIPLQHQGGMLTLGEHPLAAVPDEVRERAAAGHDISLGVRPEHVIFCDAGQLGALPVTVLTQHDYGRTLIVDIDIDGASVKVKIPRTAHTPSGRAWIRLPKERICFYAEGNLVSTNKSRERLAV